MRGIERMTGLPLGQVLYHLDRLERMGIVASSKDAGFRRYYVAKEVGRGEKKYLAALRHEVPRRVVLALLERPGLSHKDLQGLAGVAGSTLSFHLERLLGSGVLVRRKVGGAQRYFVAEPAVARHELIFYRESFADEEVDRFVRRQLACLPGASVPGVPPPEVASPVPVALAEAPSVGVPVEAEGVVPS